MSDVWVQKDSRKEEAMRMVLALQARGAEEAWAKTKGQMKYGCIHGREESIPGREMTAKIQGLDKQAVVVLWEGTWRIRSLSGGGGNNNNKTPKQYKIPKIH